MVSPFHSLRVACHMNTWGERDETGGLAVRIVPHDGPAFTIPVVVDHKPQFEPIEGHSVENPSKLASFSVADWRAFVGMRDPDDDDVIELPMKPKRWSMTPASPTNDGRFEVPLMEYVPR